MVEPISMAVGSAIGIAGMYSTCLQAIEDYQAVQNFESDSQWLVDLFEAERILLKAWGKRVGIENKGGHHPCLDESSEEYVVVKRLLEHIKQIWVDADAISRKYNIKLMGNTLAGGSHGLISFTPRKVSLRRRVVWASRDKAKYKRLVENLSYLTHKLNDIASLSDDVRQLQYGGEDYKNKISRLRGIVEGDRKMYFDHIGGISVEAHYRAVTIRATDEGLTEFLSSEGFQSWFSVISGETSSSLLWLRGEPGVGKTVLTATMIEHLKENSLYPAAFFFCHYGQPPWNNIECVLRSWIAQLARQSVDAFEVIQHHFPESPRGLAKLEVLWRTLSDITRTLDSCYLILDALDECDDGDNDDICDNPFQGNIGRFLHDLLYYTRDRGAKIFISSRRIRNLEALSIERGLSSTEISLYQLKGRSERNTRAYIDSHLIDSHYSESDRRRLVDAIEKRCGGDRTWVSMELGYISWVEATESIDQLLYPKSPTIEGLSMRIVERICNLEGRDRDLARYILELAIFYDENRYISGCDLEVGRMDKRSAFVGASGYAAEASRLCGPAITMSPEPEDKQRGLFAQGFVKSCLLRSALFGDLSHQHAVLSNMALAWYLTPNNSRKYLTHVFGPDGPDWPSRFQMTSGDARVECLNHQRNLLGMKDNFREFARLEHRERVRIRMHDSRFTNEPVGELTPLTFTCRYGLVEMCEELMASSSNIDPNSISVAAWNGAVEIVRMLLSRDDIDPNVHSIEVAPLTPLGFAIVKSHLEIVEALLDSQSVLANGGFVVETLPPQQEAAIPRYGCCWCVSRAVVAVGDVFPSPLRLAVISRNRDATQLLLSRHKPAAMFRSVVEFHQIMLMTYAARRGYGSVISRLLFGKYLDINPVNKYGKTALDLAVSAGYGDDLAIWEMLEERKAWSGDDLLVWVRWYSRVLRILFFAGVFLLLFRLWQYEFWPGGVWGLGRV